MGPIIDVDLDAIVHNYLAFADAVQVPVLSVVKADAYGHGALPVARAVTQAGCGWLGVVDISEALALRAGGVTDARILTWMHSPATDWAMAFDADIDIAVSTIEQLSLVERAATKFCGKGSRAPRVHLKLDTGLGRNGATAKTWRALIAQAAEADRAGVLRVCGLMSHLSGTGAAEDLQQGKQFAAARELAQEAGLHIEHAHIAATAGAMKYPQMRHDLVRLGISLYGLSPEESGAADALKLRPALRLRAPIRRFDNRWAVAVGEGDGLPPLVSALPPLVDSQGTYWKIDRMGPLHLYLSPMGDVPVDESAATAAPARELVVIGHDRNQDGELVGADADDWARAGGTINYEITTRLTRRILRDYGGHTAAEGTNIAWPPMEESEQRSKRSITAPLREAVIDLELLQRRLTRLTQRSLAVGAQRRSAEFGVDVSSDAYGHGLDQILPYVRSSGLPIVARTRTDMDALERRGVTGHYFPDAPSATRGVYGLDPREPLPPTLSLVSELVSVKRVSAGQRVSYGYEWTASKSTTLGLVPLGYADALPRSAFGKAQVTVAGWPAPIVGRIAMDQVVVDLGDRECWPGMRVQVWGSAGNDLSLSQWATWTGWSPEALCANLGSRVERRYRGRQVMVEVK